MAEDQMDAFDKIRQNLKTSMDEVYRQANSVSPEVTPYGSLSDPSQETGEYTFLPNMGGLLFGTPSVMDEYMTPAQQKAIQSQGMMNAAMALLKAGRTTTTPISFGEAIADAYQAGTAGYQGAQQNAIAQIMMRQKMEEAKRAQESQQAYRQFLLGMPTEGEPMGAQQALGAPGMPVGPTPARAAMIGQTAPVGGGALNPAMRQLLASLPAEKGIPEAIKLMQPQEVTGQPFKGDDGKFYLQTKTGGVIPAPIAPEVKPTGMPQEAVVNGSPVLVQYYEDGSSKVLSGVSPKAEPSAAEIKILRDTGTPVTLENVMLLRRSGATNLNVNTGQKGLENEMAIGKAFKSEPIYKDFSDMQTAYKQVVTALDQNTPIGDVAGATKVMKLLDPGSVVRETELGIAMAASGRMDRLKNLFDLWSSGKKLTETQRSDFKNLSRELYAAAGQAYNQKRGEYRQFGSAYDLKNIDTILGDEAKIPEPFPTPGGEGKRKPITQHFKRQP